jgi:hypothetical protein
MTDRQLFAPWFRDLSTWAAWRAFVAALFALQMSDEQLAIFKEVHRPQHPTDNTRH